MTALVITAAQVVLVSGPVDNGQIIGEAAPVGSAVYFDKASGTWKKAQCDGSVNEAGQDGYGLTLATADGPGARVSVARPGSVVTLGAGAAPIAGIVYYIGATAGALDPIADLVATNKVTPLCLGIGSNNVQIMGFGYNAGSIHA